jgi:hypothetical protein
MDLFSTLWTSDGILTLNKCFNKVWLIVKHLSVVEFCKNSVLRVLDTPEPTTGRLHHKHPGQFQKWVNIEENQEGGITVSHFKFL